MLHLLQPQTFMATKFNKIFLGKQPLAPQSFIAHCITFKCYTMLNEKSFEDDYE
jgi:hypothetical protein